MDFQLPENHKFACLAFSGASVGGSFPQQISLGNELWAFSESPFSLDASWREWMGSIVADEVEKANLVLLAEQGSESPGVLDDETKQLNRRARHLLEGVLLAGVPRFRSLVTFAGATVGSRVQIRQVGRARTFYFQKGARPVAVSAEAVVEAAKICWSIEELSSEDYVTSRLLRGLDAWRRGLLELYNGYRLHEFVRSLETILNVSGRWKFASRLKLFLEGPPPTDAHDDREVNLDLVEIYKIRNEIEHLNPLGTALEPASRGDDWQSVYTKLCLQAEIISRFVYRRVLSNAQLQRVFSTDQSVQDFWDEPAEKRQETWGARHDLAAELTDLLEEQ